MAVGGVAVVFLAFLVLLLGVAGWLWWWAWRVGQVGRIRRWRWGTLADWELGVVGRPDGYVRLGVGEIAPVEYKSGGVPVVGDRSGRRESARAQLLVYCLLLERRGWRVPYGYIVWGEGVRERVEWDGRARREVLGMIARAAEVAERAARGIEVGRDHSEAERCRRCFYREGCGERLC